MLYGQSPVAQFSIEREKSPASGLEIFKFSNESTGNPTTYSWTFSGGNPNISTEENPTVIYNAPGVYEVELSVSNASGVSTYKTQLSISEGGIIYLCSGRKDDGTLLSIIPPVPDTNWWYIAYDGTEGHPNTRHKQPSAWSDPVLADGRLNSTWFKAKDNAPGLHTYIKSFSLPKDGLLNLRALADQRNFVYLMKKNSDGTTEEIKIVETFWADPGSNKWKGFNNSWNPLIENFPVVAGEYDLKVVAEVGNGPGWGGASINANIVYEGNYSLNSMNINSQRAACVNENVSFSLKNVKEVPSYLWEFRSPTNTLTSTVSEPSLTFMHEGIYDLRLVVTHTDGEISTLNVENYISITSECDYTRAPNSYIFDINNENGYGGLYIPVKKAYAMWADENGYLNSPIPTGELSASIYWEDVPELIRSVNLEGAGENARIKVMINKAKGKGNALIAFHVGPNGNHNDPIYWSWHVWVTDDPSNGVTYFQGFEMDIDNNRFEPQFMDRNLGAVSNHFLGYDWHKTPGLMYEWGRKDPFPPLVHKDDSHYELNGVVGNVRHKELGHSTLPIIRIKNRDEISTEIEDNIKYSVQHPFEYIINTDRANWFSSKRFKTGENIDLTSTITWDLWSDNYRGGKSNGNSGNAELARDSRSYELKSPYDPCPDGWRVPSNYGRTAGNNNLSPWGRKGSGGNDDIYNAWKSSGFYLDPLVNGGSPSAEILSSAVNPTFGGIKVYPGLGYDFTEVSNRNIGVFPISGNYEYYGPTSIFYQDGFSDGAL